MALHFYTFAHSWPTQNKHLKEQCWLLTASYNIYLSFSYFLSFLRGWGVSFLQKKQNYFIQRKKKNSTGQSGLHSQDWWTRKSTLELDYCEASFSGAEAELLTKG